MSQSGVSSSTTTTTTTGTSVSTGNGEAVAPSSLLGAIIHQNRMISSTKASVDSDSDYQFGDRSNVSTMTTAGGTVSNSLSRSSSVSMLSTTAQKDGVQGRRRHFDDPGASSAWVERVVQRSSLANELPMLENESISDELDVHEDIDVTPDGFHIPEDSEYQAEDVESEFVGTADDHQQLEDSSWSDANGVEQVSGEMPNIPTAPPVTLTEKIRLLRTGSVGGSVKEAEPYIMSDPYTRSEANSVGSDGDIA